MSGRNSGIPDKKGDALGDMKELEGAIHAVEPTTDEDSNAASNEEVPAAPTRTSADDKAGASKPLLGGAAESKRKPDGLKDKPKPTQHPIIPGAKPKPKPKPGDNHNIEDEEQKKEYLDSAEELDMKVKQVAVWIRGGKHVIFFTGAGVSTGAGIPDFRSGMNTILDTGPGAWELKAHGKTRRPGKAVKPSRAIPTVAHMALVALHEAGLVKFTVSQNCDGLHRRSGLNTKQLAELHGNTNLESCSGCGNQYLRDFRTRQLVSWIDPKKHETSRRCDDPSCGSILLDSIINFGERLPESEISAAFEHAGKADVCVVLGSSLTVTPASDVPAKVGSKGKLVICNLQKTPLYELAALNVHCMCDVFMRKLVEEELKIPIPSFKLKRRAQFSITQTPMTNDWEFSIGGLDVYKSIPYSFIRELYTKLPNEKGAGTRIRKEPFSYKFKADNSSELRVVLAFQGHYNEPEFELLVDLQHPGVKELKLSFDVVTGFWSHEICEMDS